jgi:hypothetical protein
VNRTGEGSRRENKMGVESKKDGMKIEKTCGREGEESRGEKGVESRMRLKERKFIIRQVT